MTHQTKRKLVEDHSDAVNKPDRKRKYAYKCKEISSYKVFVKFVTSDEHNKADASGILSSECYDQWIQSRRKIPKKAPEAFRRALTAHCRGVDGRKPFPEEVERSLLKELRKKQTWNCFKAGKGCGSIGIQGFPSLGFHEKRNLRQKFNALAGTTTSEEVFKSDFTDCLPIQGKFEKTRSLLTNMETAKSVPHLHSSAVKCLKTEVDFFPDNSLDSLLQDYDSTDSLTGYDSTDSLECNASIDSLVDCLMGVDEYETCTFQDENTFSSPGNMRTTYADRYLYTTVC